MGDNTSNNRTSSGGLQLLVGLDENGEWVKNMKNFHNNLISTSATLSYPMIPIVRGKRVKINANMETGAISVIFETQQLEAYSLKLSLTEFEAFQNKLPVFVSYIRAVQESREVPREENIKITEEEGGWAYTVLYVMNNINVKIKWNAAKRHTLISVHDKNRYFTLSAGAFIYFQTYAIKKVTNALRLWQNVMRVTYSLRPSLMYDFLPEMHMMAPHYNLAEPVEVEEFGNLSIME